MWFILGASGDEFILKSFIIQLISSTRKISFKGRSSFLQEVGSYFAHLESPLSLICKRL